MSEDRIIELEIKAAYQEDLLQSLNNVIAQQQQQIDRLETTMTLLHERINSLTLATQSHQEQKTEIPPHY